jgi:hypothetical protein
MTRRLSTLSRSDRDCDVTPLVIEAGMWATDLLGVRQSERQVRHDRLGFRDDRV